MTPSVSLRSVTSNKDDDGSENVARNKFAFFQTLPLLIKKIYMYIYIYLYNDVNATRAVIGRCPWSIRVQLHGWRHGKLVLFNMARGFENVCEIISDWGKWKLRKKFSRSYLQRRKMEKRRLAFVFTTFWRHLWSITEQTHGNMESIC